MSFIRLLMGDLYCNFRMKTAKAGSASDYGIQIAVALLCIWYGLRHHIPRAQKCLICK